MRDMQEQLENLLKAAADCKSISDLATDLQKRELFARLADHLSVLASEVERAIAATAFGTNWSDKRIWPDTDDWESACDERRRT